MPTTDRPPAFVVLASSALWVLALAVTGFVIVAEKTIDHFFGGTR